MAVRKRNLEVVFPHAAGIDVGGEMHYVAVPPECCEESVRSFPSPQRLAEKMDRAGFERIRYTVLAGGIISIHSAVRG